MAERQGERIFFTMGLVLLAIVIGGFFPTVFLRPGGPAAVPFLLHLHGAVFLSWFVLFVVQARLIGAGNARLHMSLGKASACLAAAIVILAYFVIRGAYAKPGFSIAGFSPAASVMFPFTDIVNFVIAYALAFANRRTPVAHKRLMLVAGMLMIDPAAARLVDAIGGPPPMIVALELALFGTLLVYDFITRRRPHWTSVLGLCLFIAAIAAKLTLAQQPSWELFVNALFG